MICILCFEMIDEEELVSECINFVVDENIKEIVGTCVMDEFTCNHRIENY